MSDNTWPGGYRRALDQDDHKAWNASNYPGTLQLCCLCDQPTGRCKEDEMFLSEVGPLCEDCFFVGLEGGAG